MQEVTSWWCMDHSESDDDKYDDRQYPRDVGNVIRFVMTSTHYDHEKHVSSILGFPVHGSLTKLASNTFDFPADNVSSEMIRSHVLRCGTYEIHIKMLSVFHLCVSEFPHSFAYIYFFTPQ